MAILHTYVTKTGHATKQVTALKMIRQKCLECSNWSSSEVRKCPIPDCALYPFRLGKSGTKRTLTEEQKEASRKRLEAARRLKND